MAMTLSQFTDLNVLHWLISGAVPLLLILLALLARFVQLRTSRKLVGPTLELIRRSGKLEGRDMDNWPSFQSAAAQLCPQQVVAGLDQMAQDCEELYQGRWLPDPRESLPLQLWLTPAQRSAVSYKPAAHILASGILAAAISWLIQQPLPVADASFALLLILLPVLTALAVSLSLFAATHQSEKQLKELLDAFYAALGRHLPVFSDQTGIASLVNAYLAYDSKMEQRLAEFSSIASRLAESDMADGVRRSVEQVLTESVAPSLQQSTTALGELANELAKRQENGMQQLATQFATALSSQLAAHMRPVNREIAQMGTLMTDVKNYVEVAMRAMDAVQQQSLQIQQGLDLSLNQMSEARQAMQTDFTAATEQLSQLSGTTTKLAGLFQTNESTLRVALEQLSDRMAASIGSLSTITDAVVLQANAIKETAAGQIEASQANQSDLQKQTDAFSRQLADALGKMLQQVRQETTTIAAHSGEIGRQLQALTGVLDNTMTQFSQESAAYVQQTLDRFDENLAEIVERLTHTATEIQDAVDALPAAIQRGAQFGS